MSDMEFVAGSGETAERGRKGGAGLWGDGGQFAVTVTVFREQTEFRGDRSKRTNNQQ